jgi:soluble lytic murein transglycosylase
MRRGLLVAAAVCAVCGLVAAYALQTEPGWYVRLRYPLAYRTIISVHAREFDLDPALVAAVIYAESKFDPQTTSSAGAVGLMQLLPQTAEGIALRTGGTRFSPADLVDPDINIRYGCWYLRDLRRKYRGYPDATTLALAAYNAGQANVDRWIAATAPGAAVTIPFPETRAYVTRVLHLQVLYRRGYRL